MSLPTKVKVELVTKAKAYYIKGININYSFKTLEEMASKHGVKFENGDILVADNPKGDKRKAYKKTPDSHIILCVGLVRGNLFNELPKVTIHKKRTIEYFDHK